MYHSVDLHQTSTRQTQHHKNSNKHKMDTTEVPKTPELNTEATSKVDSPFSATSVFSYDVLMYIFNFLEQKRDLALCSGVCQLWRKVALNPVFLWEVVKQWHTEYPKFIEIIGSVK